MIVVGYNAIGYLEQKIRSSSEENGDGDDLTDKVVDDDVLLPGDHVALLLSACSHPAVSVRPEHGRIKKLVQLTMIHLMHQDHMTFFSKV